MMRLRRSNFCFTTSGMDASTVQPLLLVLLALLLPSSLHADTTQTDGSPNQSSHQQFQHATSLGKYRPHLLREGEPDPESYEIYISPATNSESAYTACQEGYLQPYVIPQAIDALGTIYVRKSMTLDELNDRLGCVDEEDQIVVYNSVANHFDCAEYAADHEFNMFTYKDEVCTVYQSYFPHILRNCADPEEEIVYMIQGTPFIWNPVPPTVTMASTVPGQNSIHLTWTAEDSCEQIVKFQVTYTTDTGTFIAETTDGTARDITLENLPPCTAVVGITVTAIGNDSSVLTRTTPTVSTETDPETPVITILGQVPGIGKTTVTYTVTDKCDQISTITFGGLAPVVVPRDANSAEIPLHRCAQDFPVLVVGLDSENNDVAGTSTSFVASALPEQFLMNVEFGDATVTSNEITITYGITTVCEPPKVETVTVTVDGVEYATDLNIAPGSVVTITGLTPCDAYGVGIYPVSPDGTRLSGQMYTYNTMFEEPKNLNIVSLDPVSPTSQSISFTVEDPCEVISYFIVKAGAVVSPHLTPGDVSTDYTFTGLLPCTTYTAIVEGYSSSGTLVLTTSEEFTTDPDLATLFISSETTTVDSITLAYTYTDTCNIADQAYLAVYSQPDGTLISEAIVPVATGTLVISILTDCTDYTYTATLLYSDWRVASNEILDVDFTTKGIPPSSITLSSAVRTGVDRVEVTWDVDYDCDTPFEVVVRCGTNVVSVMYPTVTHTFTGDLLLCASTATCSVLIRANSATDMLAVVNDATDPGVYALTEFGCFYFDDTQTMAKSDASVSCIARDSVLFEPDTTHLVGEIGILLNGSDVPVTGTEYFIGLDKSGSDFSWENNERVFGLSEPGWKPEDEWASGASSYLCAVYIETDTGYQVEPWDCSSATNLLCYTSFLTAFASGTGLQFNSLAVLRRSHSISS